MIAEERVGYYKGYEVVIKKEVMPTEQQRLDLIRTAEYLKEKVFNNLDTNCEEDLEDLLEQKKVLEKITDIVNNFYVQYQEKHSTSEEVGDGRTRKNI